MTSATLTSPRATRTIDPAKLGMWLFLATVAMLFAAFASAYLIRMASGSTPTAVMPLDSANDKDQPSAQPASRKLKGLLPLSFE